MADDHVSRDAGTGKFVSDEYAAEHPDTTVRESLASYPAGSLQCLRHDCPKVSVAAGEQFVVCRAPACGRSVGITTTTGDTTVRESRDDLLQRLAVAAREANDAMRLYNQGGMKWLELDTVFARLEDVLREVEARGKSHPDMLGTGKLNGLQGDCDERR